MKRNEIAQLLPEVIRRTAQPGSPLSALLEVMEALHAPSEELLARGGSMFNAYQIPDAFVPWLARWVDLDRFLSDAPSTREDAAVHAFPSGLGRLRALIADAARLSQGRGTAQGLVGFLETATGLSGYRIEEEVLDERGQARAFHICVRAPAQGQRYRALIQQIIEAEKPAYVTYGLEFDKGAL
jgi:phage tail-like protein